MKTLDPAALRSYLPKQDLLFLGTTPVCYHCHHFNLFLDQTIDDGLGSEHGWRLRFTAARDEFKRLLSEAIAHVGAHTATERLELATIIVRAMGHGTLELSGNAGEGNGVGRFLHYGFSWAEKYGRVINKQHTADAVACGFGAAALECAFDITDARMVGDESTCIAKRDAQCTLAFRPASVDEPARTNVDRSACEATVRPSTSGLDETRIEAISSGLKDFTAGVAGDERGLVQAFGVFVAMHLTNYYNRISYDAVEALQREAPGFVEPLEDLLRESGHVCAFNTFGGIILSPEWEGMVGAPKNDPAQIVSSCMAIGRALGFGRWSMSELVVGKRVVITTSSSYEASYYATRHGVAQQSHEYFLQGAALAIAQLAHRVDWESKPALTQAYYADLFRGGVPWRTEQTSSLQCGADTSEVVVTFTG